MKALRVNELFSYTEEQVKGKEFTAFHICHFDESKKGNIAFRGVFQHRGEIFKNGHEFETFDTVLGPMRTLDSSTIMYARHEQSNFVLKTAKFYKNQSISQVIIEHSGTFDNWLYDIAKKYVILISSNTAKLFDSA